MKVPETENVVIVYDRIEEEQTARHLRKAAEEDCRPERPAEISENNIKIYSRFIVCRMNEEGAFEGIHPEDGKTLRKYLAF